METCYCNIFHDKVEQYKLGLQFHFFMQLENAQFLQSILHLTSTTQYVCQLHTLSYYSTNFTISAQSTLIAYILYSSILSDVFAVTAILSISAYHRCKFPPLCQKSS